VIAMAPHPASGLNCRALTVKRLSVNALTIQALMGATRPD
jgi:hypothetical protein